MPMVAAAAVMAVGSLAASNQQSRAAANAAAVQAQAAQNATAAQQQAANEATALQRQMWQTQQQQQAPWLAAGQNALSQLQTGTSGPGAAYMKPFSMADYQADPGYAFRLKEGMKALEQGAAARGGLLGGNMLRGAQQYGQDMASQEYQNAFNRYQINQSNQFNRLGQMAGVGQAAANQLGAAGQNYANTAGNIGMTSAGNIGNIGLSSGANIGNALLAAGQARASGIQGVSKAFGSMFGGGMGMSGYGG